MEKQYSFMWFAEEINKCKSMNSQNPPDMYFAPNEDVLKNAENAVNIARELFSCATIEAECENLYDGTAYVRITNDTFIIINNDAATLFAEMTENADEIIIQCLNDDPIRITLKFDNAFIL